MDGHLVASWAFFILFSPPDWASDWEKNPTCIILFLNNNRPAASGKKLAFKLLIEKEEKVDTFQSARSSMMQRGQPFPIEKDHRALCFVYARAHCPIVAAANLNNKKRRKKIKGF